MRGDLGEGWDEYEWRLRSSERKGPRFPEHPWQGENLAGKHIYVQAEQGFGDTLQFARYLPLLAARAGKVTLRVHQQLRRRCCARACPASPCSAIAAIRRPINATPCC